jgi:hypothetical protein
MARKKPRHEDPKGVRLIDNNDRSRAHKRKNLHRLTARASDAGATHFFGGQDAEVIDPAPTLTQI